MMPHLPFIYGEKALHLPFFQRGKRRAMRQKLDAKHPSMDIPMMSKALASDSAIWASAVFV
jgi:hypothetical protein